MIDKMIDSKPQSFSTKMIEKQDFPTKIIDTSPTQNYILRHVTPKSLRVFSFISAVLSHLFVAPLGWIFAFC